MDAVDFLHHENPLIWAGVEPTTFGVQDQRQTNYATQLVICIIGRRICKKVFPESPRQISSCVGSTISRRDQALQDINKEFQLERVRLQAFVAASDPDCKKELFRPGSLDLLKYIIGPNLKMAYQTLS
ncbi:hypothetical protein TNCV_2847551 [Trichonephila clavipes]|nr:hypothetical protein TNCV_2847551 [Trichonephila clavipes]